MTQYSKFPLSGGGSGSWKAPVANAAALPLTGNDIADTRVTEDTGSIYTWDGAAWQLQSSGSSGVNSVTSTGSIAVTGTVTDPVVNVAFPIIAPESAAGAPSYAFGESGNDTGMGSPSDGLIEFSTNGVLAASLQTSGLTITGTIAASNYPPTGTTNTFTGFDNSGNLQSIPGFGISTTSGGPNVNIIEQPNAGTGDQFSTLNISFDPQQNSPNDGWNIRNTQVDIDPNSTGFTFGTNGSLNLFTNNIRNHGTSDVGLLAISNNNFDIGNGTDPISINGLQYSNGFGQVNDNVTVTNQVQGYGFQPNASSGAILQNRWIGFYDFANIACAIPGYQSFAAGPAIAEISNNHNYNGLTLGGNITQFSGNAGYFGVVVSPQIGTINSSGSFQGLNVNPTVTNNKNSATGLYINMNNVTNYAGVKASLVVQDITYEYKQADVFGNTITVAYTNTVLAGNEVAHLSGTDITVEIESGVSTATQVKAALDANLNIASMMNTTITGTASNPQVTYAQTSLAGGINAGNKKAIDVTGDVSIDGALSFTGALSIGQLNSFAPYTVQSGLGVASVDTLITSPSVAASATITGTDLLPINTAMLLNIGANASVTSSFLGYAALGLPAVLSMATGSTIDRVSGAVFAISLDATASGGTADEVDLCRSLAIPNGVTTVNRLKGYLFDLPLGAVATDNWGCYMAPSSAHNYFAGDVVVGTSDTPTNSSVGIELNSTTKAILSSRMTQAQRDAMTAVNGMIVYNTDTDKLQVFAGGSWVDLH